MRPITAVNFSVESLLFVFVAESFWGRDGQRVFFDFRGFNALVPSYRNSSLPQCYRKNELGKRRAYDEIIREVENGSFSPIHFLTA